MPPKDLYDFISELMYGHLGCTSLSRAVSYVQHVFALPLFFEDHQLVPALEHWRLTLKPGFIVVGLDGCTPGVAILPVLKSKVGPGTRNMQQLQTEKARKFLVVRSDLVADELDQFRLLPPFSK